MEFPPHPGSITIVDHGQGTTRTVPVAEVPEENRFAYRQGDLATHDPAAATARIPIVRVEIVPVDDAGNLAAPDQAAWISIKEYGPDGQPLRSTTMVRQPP